MSTQITVIIPAYNCEESLQRTVGSIQACGIRQLEIRLVEDGSSDRTPEICDELVKKYNNVRCVHQQNKGVSFARNRGLQEAAGTYIWFFDADDLVDPGSMRNAVRILEQQQPDMLIFGMTFDKYRGSDLFQRTVRQYEKETVMTADEVEENFERLFLSNSLTSSCNKLIRRSILTDRGISFDTKLYSMEDLHFVLNTLRCCSSVYLLPEPIYHYVQVEEAASRRKSKTSRNHNRMERIPNIAEYLRPFESLLSNHRTVLFSLHFNMMQEKLLHQSPKQIKVIKRQFCDSIYATEPFIKQYTPYQRKLSQRLIRRSAFHIYLYMKWRAVRNTLIRAIRSSRLYRAVRRSKNG